MNSVTYSQKGTMRVAREPACQVASDGAIRIVLAADLLRAGSPVRQEITVELPEEFAFYTSVDRVPADTGADNWFEFRPDLDHASPLKFGMQDWLEKPAGLHGRITREAGALQYNGQPISLWGVNLCYGAVLWTRRWLNGARPATPSTASTPCRLQESAEGPGWAGIQSEASSVKMDPDGLDRMDYFVVQLKHARHRRGSTFRRLEARPWMTSSSFPTWMNSERCPVPLIASLTPHRCALLA